MALVVEDGTGLVNANAYVDVAFADAYHRERCSDGWRGPTSKKEAAIIRATEWIDLTFDFVGDRVNQGDPNGSTSPQALAWPRAGVFHADGFFVQDDEVPEAVKRATAEAALAALTVDFFPTVEGGRESLRTERVGRVSVTSDFGGGGPDAQPSVTAASAILRPLSVGGGFGASRLNRA